MKLAAILFVLLLCQVRAASGIATVGPTDASGIWAAHGKTLPPADTGSVPAPNRKYSIRENKDGYTTIVGPTGPIVLPEVLSPPALTEVLWSSDSRAFIINTSEGGGVGKWDAYLYSLSNTSRVTRRDLRVLIEPVVRAWPKCVDPPYANLGAAAWLRNGRELLVIAEVPPHSSCQNMGALLGFRISVASWRILERISEDSLRTTWKAFLGPRIRTKAK